MSSESAKGKNAGWWRFAIPLVLVALIYGALRYTLSTDPSSAAQKVEMCALDYKHAKTQRDTAEIDALTPPAKGYVRHRQMRTCGYFREAGATR